MRFLSGLMLLLPLASPFAHAELIDEVNDRGELRIAKKLFCPQAFRKKNGEKNESSTVSCCSGFYVDVRYGHGHSGWPGASFPSAARHASLALVPVPHGERS